MTSMVDVDAAICQSIFDTRSPWRTQSEESAERLQRDRTVTVHHGRIEIELVELLHEKSDLVLTAGAKAVLCEALLREEVRNRGGSIVAGGLVCPTGEAGGAVAVWNTGLPARPPTRRLVVRQCTELAELKLVSISQNF